MGILSWIIQLGLKCKHRCLCRREIEEHLAEDSDVIMEAEKFEDTALLALKVKEGSLSQGMYLWKLEETRKWIFPQPPEEAQPYYYLGLGPLKPFHP